MASPSWVILRRIPRVSAAIVLGDAELSLALAAPPSISSLTVAERIAPDRITPRNYPFVLAADPSGLFLLSATQGRPTGPLVVDKPGRKLFLLRSFVPGYFVCDATSASAFRLPDPEGNINHPGNFGLIVAPGGSGHYMAAELQPIIGGDTAKLLCFSSETGEWGEKNLRYPLPCRPWGSAGVISLDGKLWWVDLSWGLLTCDPFADTPSLRFVSLPEDKLLPFMSCGGDLDKSRCVNVSNGKLRFVDMSSGECDSPTVGMWTLAEEKTAEWTLEYEVSFDEIWADESYKATGLPGKAPVLGLVHPRNPNVVYFFLEEYLFGVDMLAKRVEACALHELVGQPPRDEASSHFVLACEFPPSLTKGLPKKDNDISSTEESSPPASLPSADANN